MDCVVRRLVEMGLGEDGLPRSRPQSFSHHPTIHIERCLTLSPPTPHQTHPTFDLPQRQNILSLMTRQGLELFVPPSADEKCPISPPATFLVWALPIPVAISKNARRAFCSSPAMAVSDHQPCIIPMGTRNCRAKFNLKVTFLPKDIGSSRVRTNARRGLGHLKREDQADEQPWRGKFVPR